MDYRNIKLQYTHIIPLCLFCAFNSITLNLCLHGTEYLPSFLQLSWYYRL